MITFSFAPHCRRDRIETHTLQPRNSCSFSLNTRIKVLYLGLQRRNIRGVTVTNHGRRRIKERCGKSSERIAQIAFQKGLRHEETTGGLNKYLISLYNYNCTADNMRVYGDKVYIFAGEILITVYELPRTFRPVVKKLMDRREQIATI